MRWYEYKMEVDDLHASDDLKAKLLAMQPAEEAPKPARKPKKAIHFPRKTLSIAALRRPPTPPPTRWTT